MLFRNLCVLVLWAKVVSALEGLDIAVPGSPICLCVVWMALRLRKDCLLPFVHNSHSAPGQLGLYHIDITVQDSPVSLCVVCVSKKRLLAALCPQLPLCQKRQITLQPCSGRWFVNNYLLINPPKLKIENSS